MDEAAKVEAIVPSSKILKRVVEELSTIWNAMFELIPEPQIVRRPEGDEVPIVSEVPVPVVILPATPRVPPI